MSYYVRVTRSELHIFLYFYSHSNTKTIAYSNLQVYRSGIFNTFTFHIYKASVLHLIIHITNKINFKITFA